MHFIFTIAKDTIIRFAVGVLDERAGVMRVREAPVYHFRQTVKALKNAQRAQTTDLSKRIVRLLFTVILLTEY